MTTRLGTGTAPRILVLGGGYVGMYTALGLQRKLGKGQARITVVDPRSYMTYQPFLPEASAGSLEPRHVVVPLRKVLKHCEVITGSVETITHADKTVRINPAAGDPYDLHYDILVVALGSIARTLPIPGLADVGIGFKQVEEAIALRNHVLDRLDIAASTTDEAVRRRALTFVVVGGGFAGVEALGELEDMAQYARRYYPQIGPRDMRWVLVEAAGRILP
ncbi:MAG: NAD(P)/FAD-dependent oxidoreductase, partial [Jiangellaceae bacterium]